jgi:hypothetical protein
MFGIDFDDDDYDYNPADEYLNFESNPEAQRIVKALSRVVRKKPEVQRYEAYLSFVNQYIEYKPYRLCIEKHGYNAEVVESCFFDEIFYYLHFHVANVYLKNQSDTSTSTSTSTSISMLNNTDYIRKNSDKTSLLMTILADRLKLYLKPVVYIGAADDKSEIYDDDDEDNYDSDYGDMIHFDFDRTLSSLFGNLNDYGDEEDSNNSDDDGDGDEDDDNNNSDSDDGFDKHGNIKEFD